MALDALHDTYFDIHSPRGGYRWNVFASLNRTSGEQASQGNPPSQLGFVAVVAGLTALVFLAPVLLGSAPAHPETRVAFLFMAAASFLASAVQMQRSTTRARDAERSLAEHKDAIQAAGGIVLRWQLVNGDLAWSGNAARLLGISSSKIPANFRDLRSYLHPDDCLYNEISRTLRTSEQQVCWPVRIKDPHRGWKAFALKGEIGRDAGSGHPVFGGVLMPADPPAASSGEDISQRLTRIMESLPISIAIWDSQNRLMLCNRKFRQLYRIVGASALRSASFEEVQAQAQEPIAQRPTERSRLGREFPSSRSAALKRHVAADRRILDLGRDLGQCWHRHYRVEGQRAPGS